jgi:hypothetical protein
MVLRRSGKDAIVVVGLELSFAKRLSAARRAKMANNIYALFGSDSDAKTLAVSGAVGV